MLNLLATHTVALHVVILAVYSVWARGGSSPAYFWAIPWLALGIVEMCFLQPPQDSNESFRSARRRLRGNLLRDPVLYIGLGLIAFLMVQWLNAPRDLVYDASQALWEYSPPPLPGLPFSVNRGESSQVLIWAIGVFAVLIGIRHGMNHNSRRWMLHMLVYNSALLALFGLVQMATGTEKLFWYRPMEVFFFASFGYPNHASAYFVLALALNFGLLFGVLDDDDHADSHRFWLIVAAILNFLGVVFCLGRAGMVLGGGVVIVAIVYGLFFLNGRLGLGTRIRLGTAALLLILFGALYFALQPDNMVARELNSINLLKLHEQMQGDRAELANTAIEIWQDHPWAGTGGWGFRRFVALYMPPDRWDFLKSAGRANVHNDFVQYLCEHGIIGVTLMLGLIFVLLGQLIHRLIVMPRRIEPGSHKRLSWFRSVSPVVWFALVGTAATSFHSLIDLPFRNMAILALWFIILASAPEFAQRSASSNSNSNSNSDSNSAKRGKASGRSRTGV